MQYSVARTAALLLAAGSAGAQVPLPTLPATGTVLQLYGLVDVGLDRTLHVRGGSTTRLQSGQQIGSHWGVRGREDLGGGLAALFNLEAGINADTGSSISSVFFDRRSVIGLGNSFGTLMLGRQPDFTEWLNPLTTNRLAGNVALGVHGLAASGQSNRVNVVRVDNSARFESARWAGFTLGLWGAASEREPSWNGRAFSAALRYDGGPWQAMLVAYRFTGDDAQWNGSNAPVANAAATNVKKADRIVGGGASYNFDVARASAMFTDERNELAAFNPRTRVLDVNVTVPVGTWLFGLGLQRQAVAWSDGRPEDRYTQLSAGVQYYFSKRSSAYAHAATMKTSAGDFARLGATFAASPDERQSGYRLGIRHVF